MKHLLIFVVLFAGTAFGQNSYGADFLNLHCTAPDPNAPPNFGDFPRPGLVPSSAATGNAILYCDAVSSGLKISVSGSAYSSFGGSGTVSANNGSAGALANYAAAGGSTTVGPATGVSSPASNELDVGSSGVQGLLKLFGTTNSGTIQSAGNSTEIDFSAVTIKGGANSTFGSASGTTTLGTGSGAILLNPVNGSNVQIQGTTNLLFNGGKGQHLNTQAATNDLAGVCSGTTTTCSVAFTTNYTSTPSCVLTPTTAGVTSFIITTQANTGFTVTYAPSATTNFNYICVGNPN